MNMKAHAGEEMTGTNAEVCAYLFTTSLTQPMGGDWTNIYLYIANQVYSRYRSKDSGAQMPADILVESLTRQQEQELRRLKDWLYQRRLQARKDKDRGQRRQAREEEESRKKEEQPTLFDL